MVGNRRLVADGENAALLYGDGISKGYARVEGIDGPNRYHEIRRICRHESCSETCRQDYNKRQHG